MNDQEIAGEVVTSVPNEAALEVDQTANQNLETTPPAETTEVQAEEKTQAEKTFTKAEVEALMSEEIAKKTAKLLRQRDAARAQNEATEQELAKVRPKPEANDEPQETQFSTPKEYAYALANWTLQQKEREVKAQEAQKAQSSFASRVAEFREDLEDIPGISFDKLARLPLSDAAVEAILDSDMRVKIAAHLLENKEDVERITKLSPARQAVELGKLEVKLSTAPAKKISQAPTPITPVTGKASVSTDDLYDPKLQANTDAWIAAFNKKQSEKRRR